MSGTRLSILCLVTAALSSGCDPSATEKILAVDATGALAGVLFVDRDADAELSQDLDLPARNVRFALLRGPRDTVATGTTNEVGVGIIPAVPVGTYRLAIDPEQLGDSLQIPDSEATFLVKRGDTTTVLVPLQYPERTIRDARAMASGRVVLVRGVALNAWTTFGDSTVHVADSTGALRGVRVRGSGVVAGDSVRMIGRMGATAGQPVLAEATVFVTGGGEAPAAAPVSTAAAASAGQGSRDAGLVRILDARIVDASQLASGDLRLRVDDGSGVLELLLDRHAGITSETPLVPGARLDATGVLVPTSAGSWQLKPRGSGDLEARIPEATVAEARAMPSGQVVSIEGLALNGSATFGDGSVHLADRTGSIRVFQSSASFIAAGDSVRFVGVTGIADGQPIVASSRSTILGKTTVPLPRADVTSDVAATADGGKLDAALVRVANATIGAIGTVAGETRLVVDDGSGPLTVILDRDTGISAAGYAPGDHIDVTGVLIHAGAGTWILKARSGADLSASP